MTLQPYVPLLSDFGETLQEFVRADRDEAGSDDGLDQTPVRRELGEIRLHRVKE